MKKTVFIHRVNQLSSVICKGHDVLGKQNRRIARVAGLGEDDFSYYLYDESEKDHVIGHIRRLATSRAKVYADPICFLHDETCIVRMPVMHKDEDPGILSPVA
jgi:hypothetical protein